MNSEGSAGFGNQGSKALLDHPAAVRFQASDSSRLVILYTGNDGDNNPYCAWPLNYITYSVTRGRCSVDATFLFLFTKLQRLTKIYQNFLSLLSSEQEPHHIFHLSSLTLTHSILFHVPNIPHTFRPPGLCTCYVPSLGCSFPLACLSLLPSVENSAQRSPQPLRPLQLLTQDRLRTQ